VGRPPSANVDVAADLTPRGECDLPAVRRPRGEYSSAGCFVRLTYPRPVGIHDLDFVLAVAVVLNAIRSPLGDQDASNSLPG
jgi:hypothetical protein